MDEKTSSFNDNIFDLINIIEVSNLVEIFYALLNNIWIKVHFIFIANKISLRSAFHLWFFLHISFVLVWRTHKFLNVSSIIDHA